MHHLNRRSVLSAGLSIAELLVTLAILALVVALLVPVAARMRANSDKAKCLTNLRQLGAASMAFIADNRGKLFPSMFWYNPSNHPTDPGMRDYVGMPDSPPVGSRKATVFTCPVLQEKFDQIGADPLQRTYSLNFYAHAVNVRRRNDPNPAVRSALQFPGLPLNIAHPSKMWMLTDGACVTPAKYFNTYITPDDNGISLTSAPHSGRQLAVFFDGHAALMEMELFTTASTPENKVDYDAFWGTLGK